MKKVISFVLSIVMLLSVVPLTAYADDAPVIDASTLTATISSGNATATTGDTVTIGVKITCSYDISLVRIVMYKPDGNSETLGNLMTYNSTSKKYEYQMTVDNSTLSGLWRIYSITCVYKPGTLPKTVTTVNSKISNTSTSMDLSAGNFTVEGTGGDTDAPTVSSFTSDGSGRTVSPGDVVKVSAKVTDASGIASVTVNYTSPNGLKQYPLTYNSETQRYEKAITITTAMEAGDWRVAAIEAVDEYDNTSYLANVNVSSDTINDVLGGLSGYLNGSSSTADLSAGNFTVAGDTGDKTPPQIDAASIGRTIPDSREKAKAGDNVIVFVNVTDESQIMTVTAVFESPSGKTTDNKIIEMAFNSETNRYEATFAVDSSTPLGVWQISSITAVDKSVNTVVVHNSAISSSTPSADFSDAKFEVVSATEPAPTPTPDPTPTPAPTATAKTSIKNAKVTGISAKVYTGKKLTQSVKVQLGNTVLKNGTDYTVAYSNNVNVGTATVKITGKGKYKDTISKTFKINPKSTTLAKLTSPKAAKLKITWNKQTTQTTGYEIQYSTSSKFTAKTTKKATVTKNKTTAKTVAKLKSGKKYYVRIRTYKTVGKTKFYSSWSKAKNLKVK